MHALRYLASRHQPRTLTVVEHMPAPPATVATAATAVVRHVTYREAVHELRAGTYPRHKSVWLLVDAHNADAFLVEFMALYKRRLSPDPLHLAVFHASVPVDAVQRWAAYLGIVPEALPLPLTTHAPIIDVQHSTNTMPLDIAQWIASRMDLQGDVLIFMSSMKALRQLVRMLHSRSFFLQYPVVAITKHAPSSHRHGPRILVGTPILDKLLHRKFTQHVQHVIDCGKAWVPRLAGDAWITQNLALRRMLTASRKGPGVCLKLYPDDAPLPTDPIATHYLDTEVAHASITLSGGDDPATLFGQGMPGIIGPLLCESEPLDILRTMAVLRVGRAAARCIHLLPRDVGLAVAAIMEGHDGPRPQENIEMAQKGRVPTAARKRLQEWTAKVGRSPDHVLAALRRTKWAAIRPALLAAYAHQTAVRTGIRQWYVDVATGRLLTCPSPSNTPDDDNNNDTPAAVVYTLADAAGAMRRCIPAAAHDVGADTGADVVIRQTLASPVDFVHELQIQAAEHFFAAREVAATVSSPTTVDIAYLKTHDRQAVVDEWLALALQEARARPLCVSISDQMALLMTAGLRASDAVMRTDFVVLECPGTPTSACLERLARLQGAWAPDGRLLLPSRHAMQDAWNAVDQAVGKSFVALDRERKAGRRCFDHSQRQPAPPRVVSRLVVRIYHGKSTGRATVTQPPNQWRQHARPTWKYDPNTRLLSGIPPSWDELDLARTLRLTWHDVKIERRNLVVRRVPAVRDLLRKIRRLYPAAASAGTLTCTRKAHYTEYGVEIEPRHRDTIRTSVVHDLPPRHAVVNQPLRAFWRVHAEPGEPGSNPTTPTPSTTEFEILRAHAPHAGDILLLAIDIATEQAQAMTPTILWLPALAYAPWVESSLPSSKLVARDGPRFVIHGPPATKTTLTRKLEALAEDLPPSPLPQPACPICWEERAYFRLKGCGCTFCVNCIVRALAVKCEDDAFVDPIQCPLCREPIVTEDAEKLVRPEHLHQFALRLAGFLSKRQPTMVRECPAAGSTGCQAFGRAAHDGVFDCKACAQEWCCVCSDAKGRPVEKHVGYCLSRQPQSDAWRAFHKAATDAGAKSCPVCKTLVAKDGGCNHVACPAPRCHTHFCWKCAQAFSSQQVSPMAQGVVEAIDPASGDVLVKVAADTWRPPCLTPCPSFVKYRRSLANMLLAQGGEGTCQVGSLVWVYTYIYDHIDACVEE